MRPTPRMQASSRRRLLPLRATRQPTRESALPVKSPATSTSGTRCEAKEGTLKKATVKKAAPAKKVAPAARRPRRKKSLQRKRRLQKSRRKPLKRLSPKRSPRRKLRRRRLPPKRFQDLPRRSPVLSAAVRSLLKKRLATRALQAIKNLRREVLPWQRRKQQQRRPSRRPSKEG